MSRITTAALCALLLALCGCGPRYAIDTRSPLGMLPDTANTLTFRTGLDACWATAGTEPDGLELYRDKDREWWLRCPARQLAHLGPGPQPDLRALPPGALTPELQRLRDGMYTVQAEPCGAQRLCAGGPGLKARLAIRREGTAVLVEGLDYSGAASLYAAIMDGADPATLTPERRLAPVFEAELREGIMANILARRHVDQNVELYSRLYGERPEQVRAFAASRLHALRLQEYRRAFAEAATSRDFAAFAEASKDFDPDGLRPRARLRAKQLRAQEARDRSARQAAEKAARSPAAKAASQAGAPGPQPPVAEKSPVAPRPVQAGRITVTANIVTPGNYDIVLRIDNLQGKPDGQSPGVIGDKGLWWHSKTIDRGREGRTGGRYTYEVRFRNVRNHVCSGTFFPDGTKASFQLRLNEDCTDAGSRGY